MLSAINFQQIVESVTPLGLPNQDASSNDTINEQNERPVANVADG
jgi:hypothetical protein